MFDDLMSEMLDEIVQIKPCDNWSEAKLAVLQVYAKENLNLEREFSTFSHNLKLNLKRTPKLQLLFDMIREASEKNKGLLDEGLHGSKMMIRNQDFGSLSESKGRRIMDADSNVLWSRKNDHFSA